MANIISSRQVRKDGFKFVEVYHSNESTYKTCDVLLHPRKQQNLFELAESKVTYDKVQKMMHKHHASEKKTHAIQWAPGRMYVNSIGKAVYYCAGSIWCNPEWDEYRLWVTANGEDGPTWCKMCVTLAEYQSMVSGMRYVDDPAEVERIEKEYDAYCERWKKHRQQQADMLAELKRPITKKNRRHKSAKLRRWSNF